MNVNDIFAPFLEPFAHSTLDDIDKARLIARIAKSAAMYVHIGPLGGLLRQMKSVYELKKDVVATFSVNEDATLLVIRTHS